jgi:hypothetical protein
MRILLLLAVCVAGRSVIAMQFRQEISGDGDLFLTGRGEIHQGDLSSLREVLARVPTGKHVIALLLDSPGGNLIEGEKLAEQIHDSSLPVGVLSSGTCASACFLMFAAAPRRFAGTDALIGVHSASIKGEENTLSLAVTTMMARDAASYGVPPAILGKMVQTTAGRVSWLTHEDLASMGVRIIDDAKDPGPQQPRESPPRPPPAQVVQQPADAGQAEYRGVLYCRQGAGRVSVRLLDAADPLQRKILLGFGPLPTSRQFPSGSFLMEGRFDLDGGGIELRPLAWVSQPEGFTMTGLSGQSGDGGKTFAGHATSTSCTVFTLRRTN